MLRRACPGPGEPNGTALQPLRRSNGETRQKTTVFETGRSFSKSAAYGIIAASTALARFSASLAL